MNEQSFKDLIDFTENKMKITNENVLDKATSIPSSYHHYLDLYIKELKVLKNKITEREKLYGTLYDSVRFQSNKELKNKSEIDPYINSNEPYYQLCLSINDQETIVKYLEEVLSSINKLSYSIRNYIDIKNLQLNGGL
jgi:hypothetical protein